MCFFVGGVVLGNDSALGEFVDERDGFGKSDFGFFLLAFLHKLSLIHI